jgi:capsular polysaccharide biosynthesis protein
MELTQYWGVLRRWIILIIAGTLVAALVGYGISLRQRGATQPLYEGTANVVVNYVTPPGVPYIPTLSVATETNALSGRVHDPGVLGRVAAQAHVALSQVQYVTTAVDPKKQLVTVRVVGTTSYAVAAVAQGLAQYLAGLETQQVQAQAASLSQAATRAVAQTQQRWLAAQAHYYLVCGCIAGQHQATVDPATLARLRAELDLLQANYLSAAGRYTAVENNPVPVATITAGSVDALKVHHTSPMQAMLPAAGVGLLLSIVLAALLDYSRTGSPAPVSARSAVGPAAEPPLQGTVS